MKKIIEKIKKSLSNPKKKLVLICFLLLWILTIIGTLYFYRGVLGKVNIGNNSAENVLELHKDIVVEEELEVIDGAKSIVLQFGTYRRINEGNYRVQIIGKDSNKVYIDETKDVNTINDTGFNIFNLDKPLDSNEDSSIVISLSSDSKKGEAIGIFYSSSKVFENSLFKYNGVEINRDLAVKFMIDDINMATFYSKLISYTIIGFSILIVLLSLDIKPETFFLFTALVFGLVFMMIITPMSPPDEQIHYENSFELSNILFGKDNYQEIDDYYGSLSHFVGHKNASSAFVRFIRDFNEDYKEDDDFRICKSDVKDNYLALYIPQTIGVHLGRLFKLNMLKTFYLGRFTNLLFYCLCIYLAIKITPVHKSLFGVIASLPIFIQQASSYSYDSFINGLCLLELAFILKWILTEETIKKSEFIFAFIVCLLLAPAKYVYGFLTFLFIFVPYERFGSKKKKALSLCLLFAPSLTCILYQVGIRLLDQILRIIRVNADTFTNIYRGVAEGERPWNINYAYENPVETILLIIRTIRYWLKTWFFETLGKTLSGQTLLLPNIYVYFVLAILLVLCFTEEKNNLNLKFRISDLFICCLIGLATIVGMMLGWTPRGANLIEGVQGRYFCPLLFYLFIIFNNKKISLPNSINKCSIYLYLLLFFEVISYILAYTFVN